MSRTTPILQHIGLALWLALTLPWASAATLERGNGPEPSTLHVHRCQELACGNILRDQRGAGGGALIMLIDAQVEALPVALDPRLREQVG